MIRRINEFAAIPAMLLALAALVAAALIYVGADKPFGQVPIVGGDDVQVAPSIFGGPGPLEICERAEKVTWVDIPRGRYYKATDGRFTLTYANGDEQLGFFFNDTPDYPDADTETVACLARRAIPGEPS